MASTYPLSSPSSGPSSSQTTGSGAWALSVTQGDIFELLTGAGDDTVVIGDLDDTDANEVNLQLGAGDDWVDGSATTATIRAYGDAGDDLFVGGGGDDVFDGGMGIDDQ